MPYHWFQRSLPDYAPFTATAISQTSRRTSIDSCARKAKNAMAHWGARAATVGSLLIASMASDLLPVLLAGPLRISCLSSFQGGQLQILAQEVLLQLRDLSFQPLRAAMAAGLSPQQAAQMRQPLLHCQLGGVEQNSLASMSSSLTCRSLKQMKVPSCQQPYFSEAISVA